MGTLIQLSGAVKREAGDYNLYCTTGSRGFSPGGQIVRWKPGICRCRVRRSRRRWRSPRNAGKTFPASGAARPRRAARPTKRIAPKAAAGATGSAWSRTAAGSPSNPSFFSRTDMQPPLRFSYYRSDVRPRTSSGWARAPSYRYPWRAGAIADWSSRRGTVVEDGASPRSP